MKANLPALSTPVSASANDAVIQFVHGVPPETPIEAAIAHMQASKDSYVLITDEQQHPIGIFTERNLVRLVGSAKLTLSEPISTMMTCPVKTLRAANSHNAFSLFQQMQRLKVRHLPIVDDQGRAIGIVTKSSLRTALTPSTLLKLKLVQEVMEAEVVCAPTDATIRQIAQKMAESAVSCIVIVSDTAESAFKTDCQSADCHPIGIITERDIVQFQMLGLNVAETEAHTVMSTPLLPARLNDSLWQIHQQMNRHRVRRFVVCNREGALAGLITQSSLLQALNPVEMQHVVELLQSEVEQLQTENQVLLELQNYQLRQAVSRTAELRQAEYRWRNLLENVQLLVVGIGTDEKVTYTNPFFLETTGYTATELIDANWFEWFVPPDERSQINDYFQQLLQAQSETSLQYQNTILTKSGEPRIIVWNNTLLRDLQNNVIGSMSIGEDITERFAIETMKGEFVAMVSHELRTPLTAIHGGLKLLGQGIVPTQSEEGKRLLQVASESSERLVRLVNDILDLERLESGKSPLNKKLLNTQDMLHQVIDSFEMIASQKQISLAVMDSGVSFVADPDRLHQVFSNLLSNAIKFSPAHSTIALAVKKEAENVLFSVCDQGIGISADQCGKIFERFVQGAHANTNEKGGTGLGLTICQNIVEQHGGSIWVDSTVGKGSCFYFRLPLGD